MGHVQYIRGRLFAWLLDLKESKFVVGYAGTELDIALERGEIDARAVAVDTVSMSEGYEKLVDFHAILEIPKGHRPCQFANLPEIEAFVRSDIESLLLMSRLFWGVGTLFICPQAHRRTSSRYSGKPFVGLRRSPISRTIQKASWVYPTPLMPEDQQKLVAELPRDSDVVKAFKTIAGMDPLPPRR